MCWPSPVCGLANRIDPAKQLLANFDKSVIESNAQGLVTLGNVWLKSKTPDLTAGRATPVQAAAPGAGHIETILGYVTWIGFAVAIMSLIWLGGLVAARIRAGEGIAAAGRIGAVLAGVLILSSASALVAKVLPRGPHGVGGASGFLQSSLWWYMVAAAICSVIIGAIRMIWEQRAQPGRDLIKSLLTLIVVAAAGVTIVNMLVRAGDSFSATLIDHAMSCTTGDPGCFAARLEKILKLGEDSNAGNGILVMILIAVAELLTLLIQIVLLLARSGMLVLLAGVLPIAASATNTEMGSTWFKRCVSWLVAFLLYKPVASLIYAAAYRMIMSEGPITDQLLGALTGAMLLVLSVLTLPALLRFVAPMTSAASSGHGAGAAATLALASRLPSGAQSAGVGGGQSAQQTTRTTTTTSVQGPSGANGATGAGVTAGGRQSSIVSQPSGRSGSESLSGSSTGSPSPAGGTAMSSRPDSGQSGNVSVTTTTETAPQAAGQSARGRRYGGGGAGASAVVQAAAMAASAAHAVAEEATGSQR